MVAADKDVIVLRTFSKVYGMAGIRCGFAVGRPDLLAKLQPYGQNAMPITGSAAANVSLLDAELVPQRKKIIGDIRNDTFTWLAANNYKFIPSQSNCFMIDTGRDGKGVIAAMQKQERLHRPHLAHLAELGPHHRRQPRGHGRLQDRLQGSHGCSTRHRRTPQPLRPQPPARPRIEPSLKEVSS